jgi:polar amino acid transport system permease protein
VIAVTDLMRVSQQLSSASYRPLEVYSLAACFYLAITTLLSLAGRGFERRMAKRI